MINYLSGDATKPQGIPGANKIICHICNDQGSWNKGFVVALRHAFPKAEHEYRALSSYVLGSTQFVDCNSNIIVANMIAQHGISWIKDGSPKGCPPIRYDALFQAMSRVEDKLASSTPHVEIHAPKFGAGLAGGSWSLIELLIDKLWAPHAKVFIYEYRPSGDIFDV